MRSRLALFGTLLLCAVLVVLAQRHLQNAPWRSRIMSASQEQADGGARPPGVTDADSLRDRMSDPYRLRPDLRFLAALGHVDAMLGVPDSVGAGTEFRDGRWWITCGGREVGSLSELPDFDELDSLLVAWARVRLAERPQAIAGSRSGSREADQALARLDALWAVRLTDRQWRAGEHGIGRLAQAAHGLTWLALETVDLVGASDPVVSRAFAAVALGRAAGLDLERDRSLLAETMGYDAVARTLVRSLPARDAVRLYVERDGAALRAVTEARNATELDRYLYLVHLARLADLREWERASQQRMALGGMKLLATISTGLSIDRFEAHEKTAAAVLLALANGLNASGLTGNSTPGQDRPWLAEVIHVFERVMRRLPSSDNGPFFDGGIFRSYYRSLFYSSLDRLGSHYLESLSSVESSKWFSEEMDEDGDTPGAPFQRGFAHLAAAKAGKPDLSALERDLDAEDVFGAPLKLRAMDEIEEHLEAGDPRGRADARRIAKSLDTRPAVRWRFSWLVGQQAQVLGQADRLRASAADAMGLDAPRAAAWCTRFRDDPGAMKALIEEPRMSARERAAVLSIAADMKSLDRGIVDRAYRKQIADAPDDFTIAEAYAKYLDDRGEYTRARNVLLGWQKRGAGVSLEPVIAGTAIARLYQKEGRLADALAAIGSLEQSQQFGAMARKASLLFEDGQRDTALKLAFHAWMRYPDSPRSRVPLVELLWKSGRYDYAASVLTQKRYPLPSTAWAGEVAPKFLKVFKGQPDDAVRAIRPLVAQGPISAPWISNLAAAAGSDQDWAMAFELESRCLPGGIEQLQDITSAYSYLKKWKGEAEALAWIQKRAPMESRPIIHVFAHQFDCDELAWTLEYRPRDESTRDYLWLQRSLAILRQPALAAKRAEATSFLSKTRGSYYLVAARYLLGLADRKDVLALANTPKRRCELYYFIGARAEAEGRLAEAADWYGMSVETGQNHNGEWRWAAYQLTSWHSAQRSLDVLAQNSKVRS